MFILIVALIMFFIITLARNSMVYSVRTSILNDCSKAARTAIYSTQTLEEIEAFDLDSYYEPYDNLPSYEKMLFQLTKWKKEDWL